MDNKSCKTCLEMKRGDCFGKQQVCDDYKYAPPMTEEKKQQWPKYGDATAFRLGKTRRN